MTAEEYGRHLVDRLCWVCHEETHSSHEQQRQCPQCRRKWSYKLRRLEWLLLDSFCQRENAYRASRISQTSYHAARRHFAKFNAQVAQWVVRNDAGLISGLRIPAADGQLVELAYSSQRCTEPGKLKEAIFQALILPGLRQICSPRR